LDLKIRNLSEKSSSDTTVLLRVPAYSGTYDTLSPVNPRGGKNKESQFTRLPIDASAPQSGWFVILTFNVSVFHLSLCWLFS
jgi:hypothetical protein